ncbi:MAG: hypothetical protein K8J31_09055 [Anaerolineae bacterium]|nr:hypothetical protein [Anaerolineae bacterium]
MTQSFDDMFDHGRTLFITAFNRCDGQGRPATTGTGINREPNQPAFSRVSAPDSNACSGCHNQPRPGGAGDFVANVFVLAQAADPVLDTISDDFSNNRNTLGMFGAGPIEMLAREMTTDLQRIREDALAQAQVTDQPVTASLDTKGVHFGTLTAYPDGTLDTSHCEGVDADLIIKPFHQAGVVTSIREFTVNAMNHHHGMQAEEWFDLVQGSRDFDEDGVEQELTIGDITTATIWQAALGTPSRRMPDDPQLLALVERGEEAFAEIGCASCHVPELKLESRFFVEPNPFNPEGTFADGTQAFSFDMTQEGDSPRLERVGDGAVVRAYTDLKRHDLCDPTGLPDAIRFFCDEQLAQNQPDQDGKPGTEFFLTRKLWDVGNSAPYGHRGNLTTIAEAILMHGGEARASRDAFTELPFEDQQAVVDFLRTLQVLPQQSA